MYLDIGSTEAIEYYVRYPSMPKLKAHLCNCLIGGKSITHYPGGRWTRDTIIWNLNGYELNLKQKRDFASGSIQEFLGGFYYTTDVIVHDVSKQDRKKAMDIVCDLSILLSLVCESRIWPFKWEFIDRTHEYSTNASSGIANFFRPALEIRDGEAIHNFIDKVWNGYQKEKKRRKIKELTHYLCIADTPGNPVELQLIIAFTMLGVCRGTC